MQVRGEHFESEEDILHGDQIVEEEIEIITEEDLYCEEDPVGESDDEYEGDEDDMICQSVIHIS